MINVVEKVKVVLIPDTNQLSYQGMKPIELHPEVLEFTDGSIRVTIPDMKPEYEHMYCTVDLFIESMNDVMIAAQIRDIILNISKQKYFTLNILSTSYTRYDRVMFEDKTDSFGAKVFAAILRSTGFDFFNFIDCHSNVMIDLIGDFDLDQAKCVEATVGNLDNYNLIAPDKGAVKKNPNANIICNKVRDVVTGNITGMEITHQEVNPFGDKFLVIDDICEGGRTFLEVAQLYHRSVNHNQDLELYITHGIFSNNAIPKLLQQFSKLHVYIMKKSLYDALTDLEQSRINVHTLVNV